MNKTLKIIFFLTIGIAVLFFIYRQLRPAEETSSSGLTSEGTVLSVGVDPTALPPSLSQEEVSTFTSLLSTLQSVSLDTSFFTNEFYVLLRDNNVELGDMLVGKSNPFSQSSLTEGILLSQLRSQSFTIQTVFPEPSRITQTSAEFSANVVFEGPLPVSVVFQYQKQGGELLFTPPVQKTTSGFVTITVDSLEPRQTYTVTALGTRGTSRQLASPMTFTTR